MAKILVADDNSNIQKMVGLALKDQGIDVVAVGNGEAAVRKLPDVHPDLVLADVFMPVRNGYEVCQYIKENPAYSHIPVILLVGAFDPLDEQEAQRVGADGVLKKPFVPPDPLISMVKAALTRAGVSLNPVPAAEKAVATARRSTADIFNVGGNSKLAALSPEKLPEATPVPVDEFPTPPPPVKIAEGTEPLAFGSLMDTPEAEDDSVFSPKPMINLAKERKWDEETDEVEEEEEENSPHAGWHPDGLAEVPDHAVASSNAVPDWRDEAFHGSSPAKNLSSPQRMLSLEQPEFAEAAVSESVAVTTAATKPAEGPLPFTGDAWAAAMAAGAEEKLEEVKEIATVAPETELLTQAEEHLGEELPEAAAVPLESTAVEAAPVAEKTKPTEPANWATVPETAWELEARKASLLAFTWDAPKPPSVEDTQDVLVYAAEEPVEQVKASAEASPCSGDLVAPSEPAGPVEAPANGTPSEPAAEASEAKSWENAWEAPAVPATIAAEEVHAETLQLEEHQALTAPPEEAVAAQAAQPDIDELVTRVLGKMNPEVLQKVTHEILKPLIEAIVRNELDCKKS